MNTIEQLDALLKGFEFIDLAPLLENGIPRWPTHPPVMISPVITHDHDKYYCQNLCMGEHSGAHVDAPAHQIPEMMHKTIERYPASILFSQAVVYPLWRLGKQPGERISAQEIREMERDMGTAVGPGEIALLDFGWFKYWATTKQWQYYAENEPGLAEDAVLLFAHRKVRAVGSDTISCDMPVKDGKGERTYGHKDHWLPQDILIMEELQNLGRLPVRCYFMALPLKIKNGSGSPIRPVALVPKEK